ncbi:hypothetical protein [Micromonospora maris]|uniref:hypothetical protein n=1 Tax=Micromonospora maris TaxID=1003110 RepID=UPI002E104733|nr:hypothetical protein OG712_29215 [Micromonospora maris]
MTGRTDARHGPPSAPVVDCTSCAGAGVVTEPCRCGDGGDRLLVDGRDEVGQAYQDCLLCGGGGRLTIDCEGCRGNGRRRAQVVLTVADLDTGAVASANVVPGSVEPTPAAQGGWCLDLTALIGEQAVRAGLAAAVVLTVPLRRWRPGWSAARRRAMEAEAIARQGYRPWWLLLGRSAAPPAEQPEERLSRLCAMADVLRLDLVIEGRRQSYGRPTWHVRFDLPGAEVPAQTPAHWPDLPTAVAATSDDDALFGLTERGMGAPAYTIDPHHGVRAARPVVDLAQLGRRLVADLHRVPGAQAVWRDGRWWYVRLVVGGSTVLLTERETGQVARQVVTLLRRVAEPPAPSWQGVPVPYTACPDCVPGGRLTRCDCLRHGAVDGQCRLCDGAGYAPAVFGCPGCRGSRRRYALLTVTVTDLASRVDHELWLPGDGPTVAPGHRLGRPYRLADQAAAFGVRPEDLTEADGGRPLGYELREGLVLAGGPNPQRRFVASAAAGRPAARLIVVARRPDAPPLSDLIRLAHGLSLSVLVSVQDDRPAGMSLRWAVSLIPGGLDPSQLDRPGLSGVDRLSAGGVDRPGPGGVDRRGPGGVGRPHQLTVEAAVAFCLRHLDDALRTAVPTDPGVPIPVPQAPASTAPPDPVPDILALAARHTRREVTVEIGGYESRIHLRGPHGWQLLAQAATLGEALRRLR